ncbi:MAG: ComF family protein [Candidatus Staskawiczbacteria bacterium]|nr:ComF family protein [Candidatus Staskawiczbacteria bacterium]
MGINILDLIFPKFCVGCGKWGTYFCPKCIKNIAQTDLVCPNCEKPAIGGAVHPLCKKRYGLDGLWSLGIYQNPLKKIIQKLKYKYVREVVEVLVNLMVEYWAKYDAYFLGEIKKDGGKNWVVIPVPLHPKRQNWRGFNQSALVGQTLSKNIGLAYSDSLKRIRHTKPQVSLKSWQRKQNIKNAFSLSPNYEPRTLNYLLVDDVWTTGSTLKECCYILKRGGAQKVWAVTLAR